jgi:hypothetical protein
MPFPYGVTVTVVRRTVSGRDEYGNDTYSSATEDISPCVIQPGSSSEVVQFTDQLSTDIVVYFPYGTDVEYVDALIYNGIQYEVQGQPQSWLSPFSGNTAPVEVRASKVTGVSV